MVALTQAKVTWWATQGFMRLECHGCSAGTAHVRRSSQVRSHVTVWERGRNTQAQTLSSEKLWKRLRPKEVKPAGCRHMWTYIYDDYIYLPRADSNSRGVPGHAGEDEEERELGSWEDTRHSCSCSSAHNLSLGFFRDQPRLQTAVVVSWGFCFVDTGYMDDHQTVLLDPGHHLPVITPRNLASQAGHHLHFTALQLPRHVKKFF